MAKRTGPTNPRLKELIEMLRMQYKKTRKPIWRDLAERLEKATRQRIEVNLKRIERYAKEGETIVVPGVVLGDGNLTKKLTIFAWRFSSQARKKIEKANGKALSLKDLIKLNPEGKNLRLMG